MRVCKNCQKDFPILIVVDGKERNLGSRSFCLECSPFGKRNTSKTPEKRLSNIFNIPLYDFLKVIKESYSRSEVFEKLGMRKGGAAFRILNRRINDDKIDISHFQLGGAVSDTKKFTDEELFTFPSPIGDNSPRKRVLKGKLIPYTCKECGIGNIWNGKQLILQLDHINGIRNDNRLSNLRFLCPNCHAQTPTFCRKTRAVS